MGIKIWNDAGEHVHTAETLADAVAWWRQHGRAGDYIHGGTFPMTPDRLLAEIARRGESCLPT